MPQKLTKLCYFRLEMRPEICNSDEDEAMDRVQQLLSDKMKKRRAAAPKNKTLRRCTKEHKVKEGSVRGSRKLRDALEKKKKKKVKLS